MPEPNQCYRRAWVYVVWFEREAVGIPALDQEQQQRQQQKLNTDHTDLTDPTDKSLGNDLFIPFPIHVNPRPKGPCNPCRVLLLLLPLEPNAKTKGHSQAAEWFLAHGSSSPVSDYVAKIDAISHTLLH